MVEPSPGGKSVITGSRSGGYCVPYQYRRHYRRDGLGAREWAAPRLDDAAEAITVSVAPKVSAALHSAASQVRPTPTSTKTGLSRLLDWRWLVGLGAVAAAAGTTAAVAMRRRYASATAAAKAATEPDVPVDESPAEDAARSQVNGQVTTPER